MLWPDILHGVVTSASKEIMLGPGPVSSGDGNTLSYHCLVSHHLCENIIKNAVAKYILHPTIWILFEA